MYCLGVDLLSNGKNGLHGNVHNRHALGTKMERKNLEGVGDEKTRETNVVEDTEEPHEGDLAQTSSLVGIGGLAICASDSRVLVDGTNDGPNNKRTDHTTDGSKEQRSTTDLVDKKSSSDGERKIDNLLSSRELKGQKSANLQMFEKKSRNLHRASCSDQ